LSPEELSAQSTKAAQASAFKRRSNAEPRSRNGLSPGVRLEDIVRACVPALSATFEHDGSPDWSARLAAAGVLVLSFPRVLRDTPEKVSELIEKILPEGIRDDLQERLEAGRVYKALREEWLRLPHWNAIRGLYWEPFPRPYVAPWEDYETVCHTEIPKDVP